MKLFVPGRLCLFGEHSDWAGEYRTLNPALGKGYTLLTGINQGIYAEVEPHPSHLMLWAPGSDERDRGEFQALMELEKLLALAKAGGFFSYVAGVAYQVRQRYDVGGVTINNYHTDLPLQKGLSSSAAICVLVARAFNLLYNLGLTVRDEMELAYQGEITTPSRCGRMDQACAYGQRPVLMVFDGESSEIVELTLSRELCFVIVDLGSSKNTQAILTALHRAYPVAIDPVQKGVQYYLGTISAEITRSAAEALQQGETETLGGLMKKAQAEFDRYLLPACPTQFEAPLLHKLLDHPRLQPYILGGKGVGSQGDGTVQLMVKDRIAQSQAMAIVEADFPQMQCFPLILSPA